MILNNGVYPTMITPYTKDNKIDFNCVDKIVEFYYKNGCEGIFAVCQSSEMAFLSLDERVALAKRVVEASKKAPYKMNVVASGHNAFGLDEQIEEIKAIYKTGIDAFVLVSNKFDINNDGDDTWIKNAEYVLSRIPKEIPLGIYECPMPYKRLLTPRIIEWCKSTGRFKFIKDTCCNPTMLKERLIQLESSGIKLFNANAQTLMLTLENGGAGYSGIMANFHPDLYVWLCKNHSVQKEKAKDLQAILSMYAFEECMHYPVTAKYNMNLEGIKMELFSRSRDQKECNEYEKFCVKQSFEFAKKLKEFVK